jgi:hypothetical protein
MDKELEVYYDNQFSMMSQPGWLDFLATVEAMTSKESQIMHVTGVEDLYKRQGRLEILSWIKGWKSACEDTLKRLKEEEEDNAPDV